MMEMFTTERMRGVRKFWIVIVFMGVSWLVTFTVCKITGTATGVAGIIAAIGAGVLYIVGGNVAEWFAKRGKEVDPS